MSEPKTGFAHRFAPVDITEAAAVNDAVAAPPSSATLLVNNAGMSDGEWVVVISTNLTGAFNMIRAVAPGMATCEYGRIVNINSINRLRRKFGQANYAAAKLA